VSGGCGTFQAGAAGRGPDLPAGPAAAGPPGLTRAQKPEGAPVRPVAALLPVEPEAARGGAKTSRAARILAVVNSEAILDEEVKAASYQALLGARSEAEQADILNDALTQLIDREVVLQDAFARLSRGPQGSKFLDKLKGYARKEFEDQWLRRMMKGNHIQNEEEFRAFLHEHHMSLEMIRRQWERNFMAMEYMRSRLEPYLSRIGHAQIVEYYDKHPEEFRVGDSVQWQDMFIAVSEHHNDRAAARRFAEVLVARVRQGEDFVRLAKQFDNGDSSLRNAEGIGSKRGEIRPPEAEPTLFQLRDGQVGPVVELDSGFHVIRLVKRQYAGPVPFDEKVQKEIKDKLRGDVFQREMKRIVTELKSKAVIEVAK
jgi:parvulin-like peptidyl-prolyl isomerase